MSARRLIVNADDYGLTRGVSRGIREAHLHGIVSSTTAMMNMPGVVEDLGHAQVETPRLGLGVHLVLTAGRPILSPGQIRTLVSTSGDFRALPDFIRTCNQLDLEQVRREWVAQIEGFIAATGKTPDHLDSHHHTSFFTAGLFRTMLELAAEYACAVRSPLRSLGGSGLPAEVERDVAEHGASLLAEFSRGTSDFFVADFYDEGATLPNLVSILGRLPEGTTELMCHPAYVDEELVAVSSYVGQRARELRVLTDPGLAPTIARYGIVLRTFEEI